MNTSNQKYAGAKGTAVKILAVLGLVVILFVALYGALSAIRSIPNVWQSMGSAFTSITSVFDGETNLNIVANPQTAVSGQPVTLSWNNFDDKNGSYLFSYECADGVNFEILFPTGGAKSFAFCDNQTNILVNNNSVNVVATLNNQDFLVVPVAVSFTKNGSDKISALGTYNLAVLKPTDNTTGKDTTDKDKPKTGTTNTNTNNTNATTKVVTTTSNRQNLYGLPDLSVRILETGIINRYTGLFGASSYISSSDRVGIKFEVSNIGTNVANSWRFNASLPTNPYQLYPGGVQNPLYPGDKIQFTIGFDNIQQRSGNQVTINIDPDNTIIESSESNNTLLHTIPLNQFGPTTNTGSYTLPLSSNCYQVGGSSGNTYTCYFGGNQYSGCYLGVNGYTCYNYYNGINNTSGYELGLNSTCYNNGNSVYSCVVNNIQYYNCYLNQYNYTCYNKTTTNYGTGSTNLNLPMYASCTFSGNNAYTCTYNGFQYYNCVLSGGGYSCGYYNSNVYYNQNGCYYDQYGQQYCY